jgi:hypothetical protein
MTGDADFPITRSWRGLAGYLNAEESRTSQINNRWAICRS